MTEKIFLRDYRNEDEKALADIIRRIWNYDQLCSAKTASRLAHVYLHSCLANQSFAKVAVSDGIPAGIIMGKSLKSYKCLLKYRFRQIVSIIALLSTREGRSVTNIFKDVDTIDKRLLSRSPANYGGEIAFFAVNPDFQGKGIGKKLFHALQDYMKTENIPDFYLFTDTSCNYRFYEHQGMTRRCRETSSFQIGQRESKMSFFLYDYHLN